MTQLMNGLGQYNESVISSISRSFNTTSLFNEAREKVSISPIRNCVNNPGKTADGGFWGSRF
jgi:hypothetical protein